MRLQALTTTELFRRVQESWPFTRKRYPDRPGRRRRAAQTAFDLRHIGTHQAKALGEFARILEPTEHGVELTEADIVLLRRTCVKMLVNAVRALVLLGVRGGYDLRVHLEEGGVRTEFSRGCQAGGPFICAGMRCVIE